MGKIIKKMKKTKLTKSKLSIVGPVKIPKGINKTQLNMGIRVEKEHTSNPKIAKKIAIDHILEDPKYYTKLKTLHL